MMKNPQALTGMAKNEVPNPNWYASTDAVAHMTNDSGNLFSCSSCKRKDKIYTGDRVGLGISSTSETILSSSPSNIQPRNVFCVRDKEKLLSISHHTKDDSFISNFHRQISGKKNREQEG